ncbi:hypothetical protein DVK85_10210 [Flavobacterium arcticum]|uniref:Nicotinic acid mononucleotide adenyltransferase n=1 Tax=Flavobacterium arcticum TaxID=1784713 RepID=A0A345HDC7_9FLAO|nr:hypothetical protein [Flavobacterium arcticum]AXG74587.1 hypothetical protein DVK85_10210 [Flavobacterium arcticum]KAF2512293.1 hypothetical protein E0W72_03455 [Flavobacterium arcticum]
MKNKLLLFGLSLFVLSCSSDDSSPSVESVTDFLPLSDANYWSYDVTSDAEDGVGNDYLYIANDTVIGTITYKKFKTEDLAFGFFSNALSNNGVRKSGDELLLTGTASFNFSEELPFSIDATNLVIFKENATNNQVIGTLNGVIEEEYEGYVIAFQYELTTTAKENLDTYSINGETYANVKSMEIKLNLNAILQYDFNGIPLPITIMPQQDVVVSTQYYAENIGVVHVTTDLEYQLSDLSQYPIEVPIPESVAISQNEVLTSYSVE